MQFIALNKACFINKPISRWIAGCAAFILLAGVARAAEEKADLSHLPKAVAEAAKNRFPKAELISATKESENNKVVYDIELTQDDRKYEMDIAADGTILEIEKGIDAKDLPAAVVAAVQSKYSNATFKEAAEVNTVANGKETLDHYEVVIETADTTLLELNVSLDGKSIKEE